MTKNREKKLKRTYAPTGGGAIAQGSLHSPEVSTKPNGKRASRKRAEKGHGRLAEGQTQNGPLPNGGLKCTAKKYTLIPSIIVSQNC
ncbi:MAG: hypothetical protein FWG02_02535 [Holophagaceae bacterium]|nr:hypothetical protein [Holophagaceae bacterium]